MIEELYSELFEKNFALFSFIISACLAILFFISGAIRNDQYEKNVKKIIKNNILELVKIFNRIHSDVEELNGNEESDEHKASEMALYFEQKHTRIEMIRINIENHLANIAKEGSYHKNVSDILDDMDVILETRYNPKLPLKYQLSLWKNNQDTIQSTTRNTIDVARDQLKIEL